MFRPKLNPAQPRRGIAAFQQQLIAHIEDNKLADFRALLQSLSPKSVRRVIHEEPAAAEAVPSFMEQVLESHLGYLQTLVKLDITVLEVIVDGWRILDTLCDNPNYNRKILASIYHDSFAQLSQDDQRLVAEALNTIVTLSPLSRPLISRKLVTLNAFFNEVEEEKFYYGLFAKMGLFCPYPIDVEKEAQTPLLQAVLHKQTMSSLENTAAPIGSITKSQQ